MTEREHKPKKRSRKDELASLIEAQERDRAGKQANDSRLTQLHESTQAASDAVSIQKGERDKRRVWRGYDYREGPDGEKRMEKPEPEWKELTDDERQLVGMLLPQLHDFKTGLRRKLDEDRWQELVRALRVANDILQGWDLLMEGWLGVLRRAIVDELEGRKSDELRANDQDGPLPPLHQRQSGAEICQFVRSLHPETPLWVTPKLVDGLLEKASPSGRGRGRVSINKLLRRLLAKYEQSSGAK